MIRPAVLRRAVLVMGCPAVLALAGACTPAPQQQASPAHPIVVEDHTGSAWPVAAAVASWGLPNVRYGVCDPTVRCVRVYEVSSLGWQGSSQVLGQTWRTAPGVARIELADNPGLWASGTQRREVSCHELGHAWGLPHDPSGCMTTPDYGMRPFPSGSERSTAIALTR
jgi:hypothetical protein